MLPFTVHRRFGVNSTRVCFIELRVRLILYLGARPTMATGNIADTCLRVAVEVANRVSEVNAEVFAFSIARGNSGLSILFWRLYDITQDEKWRRLAHDHLGIAAHSISSVEAPPPGVLDGVCGTGFVARLLAGGGPAYRTLLSDLDDYVLSYGTALASAVQSTHGVASSSYDCVCGLSGILGYLAFAVDFRPSLVSHKESCSVLNACVDLTCETDGVPKWHTRVDQTESEHLAEDFPSGHLNLGMAHGGAGLLAALSLARLGALRNVGCLDEAIRRVACFFARSRRDDEWGPSWATAVSLRNGAEPCRDSPLPKHPTKAAWCYGPAGISRALDLAGMALAEDSFRDLAAQAIEGVAQRPREELGLPPPTFCHGLAGLFHILGKFDDRLAGSIATRKAELLEWVIESFDEDTQFGFLTVGESGKAVDSPWLLNGAAGVALAILEVCKPPSFAWDRPLLLA